MEIDTMHSVLLVIAALLAIPCSAVGQARWFVDSTATGAATGFNWDDAFVDLQQALSLATGGDEIWVAKGIYRPDSGTLNKSLAFRVPSGVAVHGGFAGDERALSQREITSNVTTLSGDLIGDDSPPFGNQTDNCYQVVRLLAGDGLTTLSGLTIASGHYTSLTAQAAGVFL